MKRSRAMKLYLLLHAAFLLCVLLFPLYRRLTDLIPNFLSGCFLHDRLFLYCPLCGGTRAIECLLHLDLQGALTYNPFVVFALVFFLILDFMVLVRLLQGKEDLIPLPKWVWISFAVLMVGYAVLRNYLMIVHEYDPVGDLLSIRKYFNF